MVFQAPDISTEDLNEFCERWGVAELALFGSVLRKDFGSDSDVDILIAFDNSTRRGLFDLVRMQNELEAMFGRPVDLVEKVAVEKSQNYIRKNEILNSAHVIYSA